MTRASRRAVVLGALGASAALTGCARSPTKARVLRSTYGPDPAHHGDLYLPDGSPKAVVVVIHGGYWMQEYDATTTRPASRWLQQDGYAVWNLEYRKLGGGGGWPATFLDVAAGIDHLATLDALDVTEVSVVGHSAGGQLAVWAASRRASTPGGVSAVRVTRCLSLAGVLDLTTASRLGLGNNAVDRLMGGTPDQVPDRYDRGDPVRLVPAGCPVACVHPRSDRIVPRDQATAYVAAAEAAGAQVTLTEVPGDHSAVISPTSRAWRTVTRLLTD